MTALLLGALIAGLVGSPHCLGMCGGFAVACSKDTASGAAWHLGRLSTYAVLGALAGLVGAHLPGPGWVGTVVAGALLLWFSASLAGIAPQVHAPLPGLARAAGRLLARPGLSARYLFGLLSGLLPCGLVYSALALPVALGDPLGGALAMVLFGLGTVPALALGAAGMQRLLAGAPWRRRAVALGVLVAGAWALTVRAPVPPDAAPACHDTDEHASLHVAPGLRLAASPSFPPPP